MWQGGGGGHFVIARVQALCMTETGKGTERKRGLSSITPQRHLDRKLSVPLNAALNCVLRDPFTLSHISFLGSFKQWFMFYMIDDGIRITGPQSWRFVFWKVKVTQKGYRVHDDVLTCHPVNKCMLRVC